MKSELKIPRWLTPKIKKCFNVEIIHGIRGLRLTRLTLKKKRSAK